LFVNRPYVVAAFVGANKFMSESLVNQISIETDESSKGGQNVGHAGIMPFRYCSVKMSLRSGHWYAWAA
jgi:hypothetical protein